MTTALVTGSHGWVGRHVRRLLVEHGHQVVGLGRRPRAVEAPERYLQVDLRDARETAAAVDTVRPDVVFHLAAALPQRGTAVHDLVRDTVEATQNLCLALRHVAAPSIPTRLLVVGSAAQYGAVPTSENPITEDTVPRPVGAYGHAKAAAESVALASAADGRLDVTAVRPFNHVGPGESDATVAGALARRVADVLVGRRDRVRVADLDAVRDFTDVRDVARAYVELSRTASARRAYNVCSGHPVQVATVLDILLGLAGLDRSAVDVAAGGSDVRFQVGSAARLAADVGWKAEIPLEESLRELLAELIDRPANDE